MRVAVDAALLWMCRLIAAGFVANRARFGRFAFIIAGAARMLGHGHFSECVDIEPVVQKECPSTFFRAALN
jgi:hypothetical protein